MVKSGSIIEAVRFNGLKTSHKSLLTTADHANIHVSIICFLFVIKGKNNGPFRQLTKKPIGSITENNHPVTLSLRR